MSYWVSDVYGCSLTQSQYRKININTEMNVRGTVTASFFQWLQLRYWSVVGCVCVIVVTRLRCIIFAIYATSMLYLKESHQKKIQKGSLKMWKCFFNIFNLSIPRSCLTLGIWPFKSTQYTLVFQFRYKTLLIYYLSSTFLKLYSVLFSISF